MKTGKKIVFKSPRESFKVNGGAVVNYKNPSSVYFKCTSWITYKDIDSLTNITKVLRKKIKTFFNEHEIIRNYFNYSTIISLNISESRVKLNKPTFFDLDITLYQKSLENGLPLVSPKNKHILSLQPLLQIVINDLFESGILDMYNFEYHKNIKEANLIMC